MLLVIIVSFRQLSSPDATSCISEQKITDGALQEFPVVGDAVAFLEQHKQENNGMLLSFSCSSVYLKYETVIDVNNV